MIDKPLRAKVQNLLEFAAFSPHLFLLYKTHYAS